MKRNSSLKRSLIKPDSRGNSLENWTRKHYLFENGISSATSTNLCERMHHRQHHRDIDTQHHILFLAYLSISFGKIEMEHSHG